MQIEDLETVSSIFLGKLVVPKCGILLLIYPWSIITPRGDI